MNKGLRRPAAFAIVCFLCEFLTVNYSGSCAEQVAGFTQGLRIFLFPLIKYGKANVRGMVASH